MGWNLLCREGRLVRNYRTQCVVEAMFTGGAIQENDASRY